MQKFLMTRKTKERLEKERAQLEKEVTRLRKEIGAAYRLAPGDGWHDNGALEAVDHSLQIAEIRMRELRLRPRMAKILEPRGEVEEGGSGEQVKLELLGGGEEE